MDWRLDGKIALITGGTKGIGRATVDEFASLGATVIVVARKVGDELKYKYKDLPVHFCEADLSVDSDLHKVQEYIELKFGKLDILINNAGTNIRKSTLEFKADEIEYLFKINFQSAFELSRILYPILVKSNSATIINVSSISASRTVSSGAVYASAKAALSQLTRYLAVEWAGVGIRVNAIEPWYILTPLTESVLNDEEKYSKILERTPMKRIGRPEEAAALISFLAMDNCRFLTGQTITIDGGASCLLL